MSGKVIYLTNVDRRFSMMKKCCDELKHSKDIPQGYDTIKVENTSVWDKTWQEKLVGSHMIIIRFMGTTIRTNFWNKCLSFLETYKIPYYMDAQGSAEEEVKWGLDENVINRIKKYTFYSGVENYRNFWIYLASLVKETEKIAAEPSPCCWAGIFHPDIPSKYTTDIKWYKEKYCKQGWPTIGMLFYRDEWIWGDLKYQTAIIEEAKRQRLNIIPVFTNGLPNPELGMPTLKEVFQSYFTDNGTPLADVIINIMKFSLTSSASITTKDLKGFGMPVLEGYSLIMGREEWEKSKEGLNPVEVSISVSMPEFDGIIHGVPVAAKHISENGDIEYLPIQERISLLISKAKKWAILKKKQNEDKRIAIVFHNYPPKNCSIGSAFGLDTIESIRLLLQRMKEENYRLDFIPEDTKEFIKILTSHATNDMSMMTEEQLEACYNVTEEEYAALYGGFPAVVKEQMNKDWGKAPGQIMLTDDNSIMVPGTMNGNVFITVQAPRGFGMDPAKIYHDPFVAPTHQYLAFYQWIRDIWKADAVIHVGTHGNLEWLPGKATGLDRESYPELALGDLPDVYIYHMTITGEGIQAKRRGAACLVDHLPAPQAEAGSYDELEELEKTMDEYAHFLITEPENACTLEKMVRELAIKANLDGEIPYDENRPFKEYVNRLHEYIEELKNSEVHVGLHILGKAPEDKLLVDEILQLLRLPNGDIPSIYDVWAEKYGTTVEAIIRNAADIYKPLQLTYSELMMKIREETESAVQLFKDSGFTEIGLEKVIELPYIRAEIPEWKEKVRTIFAYIGETIMPNLLMTHEEVDHVMDGISGKYIESGPSGSPHAGGVSLLPSGRNFFGVDPRVLPTKAAWELGKVLGDQVIEQYIAEEGKYPENVGIVFWSGANMRSRGQCIAEFFYLMGIKPVWEKGSMRVKALEIIPLSELQRPRIDVTGRISGLFRDTMPAVVNLMDKAVLMVAELDEPGESNYVRKHIVEDSQDLEKTSGMTKEEAWRSAAYRIFGDAPGTYGAGIGALLDAKNWQTIDDLAEVYVRWGGHAFGGKTKGEYTPKLFEKRLSVMDVTIKNEDNHETNMLSSDDYNAYHGGMIAAVRSIRGKAPRSYAGDTTNRAKARTRTVQEEAKRIFRTESINPKYINGMMKHGYKGASDMAKMVSVSYQWDATSEVMEDWMYEKYAEKYAFDEKVQEWMKDVNPWALQRITETLLEAQTRGLWNAKEETLEKLKELYLSVEGELEDAGNDDE